MLGSNSKRKRLSRLLRLTSNRLVTSVVSHLGLPEEGVHTPPPELTFFCGRGCRCPSPELTSPPLRHGENLLRASRAKDRLHIAEHSSEGHRHPLRQLSE